MQQTLMVANRGEIARRIFRTCRDMGIGTVAVHTPGDLGHVDHADVAVEMKSYMDIDGLVAAALRGGAFGVHPGYGFLSENASFARAVIASGLTWVGPSPEAIEAMGAKVTAKKLMAAAGVPVLPEVDDRFPLLVKASAGGGGRGMRVVRTAAELPRALTEARSEAESAFGDPTVFCEPYLEDARHIEVQVLADQHGRVWTLGERECSVQRRHQKVIEEAPSTFVDAALRESLCAAATRAAEAIGYVGAGTVEFLVDSDSRFHFLEMNTRLQVEHPVTECVTGLDLVRLQIEIARGARLGEPPSMSGHAIEARIYAEDPDNDWLPQSGTLYRFEFPPGVRVDSGVDSGSVVGVSYDPLLAKVIAHAPTREEAAARLSAALAGARIHGLRTNRDLLVRALRHPAFLVGETTTAFLAQHDLSGSDMAEVPSRIAAARAVCALSKYQGWRNVRSQPRRKFGVDFEPHPDDRPDLVVLHLDGLRHTLHISIYPDIVVVDSALGSVTLERETRFTPPLERVAEGSLVAPMPGVVVRLGAAIGDRVQAGQPVLWLEAMKMEHQIVAPAPGVVTAMHVTPGQQVRVGTVLAVLEEQ